MEEKQHFNKSLITFGLILSVAIIASVSIWAYVFYQTKSFVNVLTVTGSAKKQVTSDSVKWISVFTRRADAANLKYANDQMINDLKLTKDFFKKNGIDEKDLNISTVFMEQVYDYNQGANAPVKYNLRQTVEVQSGDVQKITQLAKNTQELINAGVIFSTQSLEYYYSKLPELRVDLLSDAVKDAKARADKLAESSGRRVDILKSASSGVVQVLPLNSVAVADYGAYDTSTIEKEVMITVKTSFSLK
jgi:hypothetical protein